MLLFGWEASGANGTIWTAQIMDPKMDSGLMPAISEEQFNVLTSRSPEEIIGVIDQLFSSEVC